MESRTDHTHKRIIGMAFGLLLFIALVVSDTFQRYPRPWFYIVLLELHTQLARLGLVAAVLMAVSAVFIGIIRKGDVTAWFRSVAYLVFSTVLLSGLSGLVMMAQGGRPRTDGHLVYGTASVLILPFFIFVETTARKRPAMGVYIWGFALLVGGIIRSIMTGG